MEKSLAYLLRSLLTLMLISFVGVILQAKGTINLPISHIPFALACFIYLLFTQAFIMFYFIGVSRFLENVLDLFSKEEKLTDYFKEVPKDLAPYKKRVTRGVFDSRLFKRKTIPWCMLIQVLASLALLLGGAHDTAVVSKYYHTGVVYGLLGAIIIGFIRQWHYLGKGHQLLRNIKQLFDISDFSM